MSYCNPVVLAQPLLFDSPLKLRLQLAKDRMTRYPVDPNFLMMDLERPLLRTRQAHWCSYDLTGRTLLFYAQADGIDGEHVPQLRELYERIMNNRRPSGTFGTLYRQGKAPDEAERIGTHFLYGLVSYYRLTGDLRALDAAEDAAAFMLDKGDEYFDALINKNGISNPFCWNTEAFAELYCETGKETYLDAVRRLAYHSMGAMKGAHSHGYLTTLRGILKAALYSGDADLAEFVRVRRQELLDADAVLPNGDICEAFPRSPRNEGCSIADWVLLNLLYADYFDDDEAFAMADHAYWNALSFNQFVTGGFGHRYLSKHGYRASIEEAWWCCTANAGLCFAELARHAVTCRQGTLKLNFLLSGRYTLQTERGPVTVTVTTRYPTKVETVVKVEGTKQELSLRVPPCIRDFRVVRRETLTGYELRLDGRLGHTVEQQGDRCVVQYGPLILAPLSYRCETLPTFNADTTVPDGYTHEGIAGGVRIDPGTPDANGFYPLSHGPLPKWSIYEEGEMAWIGGGEVASAYVPVVFPDGTTKELYFQPLCSATSNLTLHDVLTDFADSVGGQSRGLDG
jgi:hypothetical protein